MSATENPSQELVAWVRSDDRRNQIAQALPEGVSIDRFERATATALVGNPDLAKLDRASLYLAILRAAQLGLVPDGRQAAIVPFGKNAQLIPMIGGVRDTLAEYGWMLKTGTVRENDRLEIDEANGTANHTYRVGTDRGEIIGYYAVATHRDGRQRMATYMTVAEVNDVRDKAGIAGNPAWKKWPEQMSQKTVGHRLADDVPLAPQDRRRVDWIIHARELEPAEAAATLYGPSEKQGEWLQVKTTDSEGTDGAAEPSESQPPAEDPASPTPSSAGAGTPPDEPGLSDEPEPDLGALAETASLYVPPNGKFSASGAHGPKTLAEILELGAAGGKWLAWALETISEPAEYGKAIWDYAAVFAPKLAQEALAKRELAP